jgi:hypothetical protein
MSKLLKTISALHDASKKDELESVCFFSTDGNLKRFRNRFIDLYGKSDHIKKIKEYKILYKNGSVIQLEILHL